MGMKYKADIIEEIRIKFNQIQPFLNERALRIWCGNGGKGSGPWR